MSILKTDDRLLSMMSEVEKEYCFKKITCKDCKNMLDLSCKLGKKKVELPKRS